MRARGLRCDGQSVRVTAQSGAHAGAPLWCCPCRWPTYVLPLWCKQEVDAAVAADPRGLGGLRADRIKSLGMTSPACCRAAAAAAAGVANGEAAGGGGSGAAGGKGGVSSRRGWSKELVIDGEAEGRP